MVLQFGRPRFYAAHICGLKTRKERVEALEKCQLKFVLGLNFTLRIIMPNETFKELEETTIQFAQAEAEKVYLMEYRKSLKAMLMAKAEANSPSLAIAKQERGVC